MDGRELKVRGAGVQLAAIEAGDSQQPTIVLVHGYPDTKELWSEVVRRLAGEFHVVAYDVRGAGASSAPRWPRSYDFERLADDLAAVAAAAAPGEAIHLVGHDWGAIQGWEFASLARFDGRLASFTAIAGPSLDQLGSAAGTLLRRGALPELASRARRSWYVLGLCTPGVPTLTWRVLLAGGRWGAFLARAERLAGDCAYPGPTLARDGIQGAKLYRRNLPRRILRPRRACAARVPVQLILPSGDHFISPDYYANAERYAPSLRRRTVAGSHWAPRKQPELIARWIGEFVREVNEGEPRSRRPWVRGGGLEQLAGRLALVTGAGSGIGRASAVQLAAAGAQVVLVDRDGDAAGQTAAQLAGAASSFVCDVGDEAAMQRLADDVLAEHGVPDVVLNNAGIAVAGSFLDTDWRDWRRILDVNLMGVVHGARLFARAMVDRGEGGQIVNMASAAAFQPTKELAAYAASKAAVLMLSECLRAELAPYGIGVTAVCPGIVATNITRTARYVGRSEDEQARMRERVTRIYRRRNFTPERVASDIMKAIATDAPVAVVTPEAKLARALSRFAPGALRRLAGLDALPA